MGKGITFKYWLIDLLHDERGSTSIKPLLALIGTLVLCAGLILSFFTKTPVTLSDPLVNGIVIIIIVCLGADTADKFSFKKKDYTLPEPLPVT